MEASMPVGNVNDGSPCGILATRSRSGSNTAMITDATTTAVSAAGSFGMKRWMAKIISNAPPPITTAVQFQSPIWETADQSFSNVLSPDWSTPKSLPNWPTMIWTDMPMMNPAITALEMKLVIHPSLARPATTNTAPDANANAAVSVTAVS